MRPSNCPQAENNSSLSLVRKAKRTDVSFLSASRFLRAKTTFHAIRIRVNNVWDLDQRPRLIHSQSCSDAVRVESRWLVAETSDGSSIPQIAASKLAHGAAPENV